MPAPFGIKPVIGYEKGTRDGRVRCKDASRWREAIGMDRGGEMRAVTAMMNCLWSDKPVNALVKSVESLNNMQRHVTLEALIGLMRNTGTA
jgi:hypothetical protein